MAKRKKLNEKQKKFIREYMIDLNATQAAIRAGYSAKTAYSQGQRLLKHVEVQRELTKQIEKVVAKSEISAASVLDRLNKIADRCMQAVEVYDKDGNPTGEYYFDASGANRALELLGKHLRLFIERQEVAVTMERARDFVREICDIVVKHVEDRETVERLVDELQAVAQREGG